MVSLVIYLLQLLSNEAHKIKEKSMYFNEIQNYFLYSRSNNVDSNIFHSYTVFLSQCPIKLLCKLSTHAFTQKLYFLLIFGSYYRKISLCLYCLIYHLHLHLRNKNLTLNYFQIMSTDKDKYLLVLKLYHLRYYCNI